MKKHSNINPFTNIDQFIGDLQKEDSRNIKITLILQFIMWFFFLLYILIFFVIPDKTMTGYDRIGGLFYILAYAYIALTFIKLHNNYRSVDYGVSTVDMLKQAIKRYQYFHRKLPVIIVPFLLIDIGMVFRSYNPDALTSLLPHALKIQVLLLFAIGAGLIIGTVKWYKRQKPLRDAARTMLKEIES